MDCFIQVCSIIRILSKQPQGTEVQSIFSAWKPKIGHRLIVSLVNCDIFIGFFATSPGETRDFGGWSGNGKGAQKDEENNSLRPQGSLRWAFLSKTVTFKLTVSDHHCISSSWMLENHKTISAIKGIVWLNYIIRSPSNPSKRSIIEYRDSALWPPAFGDWQNITACTQESIWYGSPNISFYRPFANPSWGVLFLSIPRMYMKNWRTALQQWCNLRILMEKRCSTCLVASVHGW